MFNIYHTNICILEIIFQYVIEFSNYSRHRHFSHVDLLSITRCQFHQHLRLRFLYEILAPKPKTQPEKLPKRNFRMKKRARLTLMKLTAVLLYKEQLHNADQIQKDHYCSSPNISNVDLINLLFAVEVKTMSPFHKFYVSNLSESHFNLCRP